MDPTSNASPGGGVPPGFVGVNPSLPMTNESVIANVVGVGGGTSHSQSQNSMIMNQPHIMTSPPIPPSMSSGVSPGVVPMEVDSPTGPQLPLPPVANGPGTPQRLQQQPAHAGVPTAAGGADLPNKMNGAANSHMSESEKNALMVVLSFLKKHNLKVTLNII